jgi:hypothetical protein
MTAMTWFVTDSTTATARVLFFKGNPVTATINDTTNFRFSIIELNTAN